MDDREIEVRDRERESLKKFRSQWEQYLGRVKREHKEEQEALRNKIDALRREITAMEKQNREKHLETLDDEKEAFERKLKLKEKEFYESQDQFRKEMNEFEERVKSESNAHSEELVKLCNDNADELAKLRRETAEIMEKDRLALHEEEERICKAIDEIAITMKNEIALETEQKQALAAAVMVMNDGTFARKAAEAKERMYTARKNFDSLADPHTKLNVLLTKYIASTSKPEQLLDNLVEQAMITRNCVNTLHKAVQTAVLLYKDSQAVVGEKSVIEQLNAIEYNITKYSEIVEKIVQEQINNEHLQNLPNVYNIIREIFLRLDNIGIADNAPLRVQNEARREMIQQENSNSQARADPSKAIQN